MMVGATDEVPLHMRLPLRLPLRYMAPPDLPRLLSRMVGCADE